MMINLSTIDLRCIADRTHTHMAMAISIIILRRFWPPTKVVKLHFIIYLLSSDQN